MLPARCDDFKSQHTKVTTAPAELEDKIVSELSLLLLFSLSIDLQFLYA